MTGGARVKEGRGMAKAWRGWVGVGGRRYGAEHWWMDEREGAIWAVGGELLFLRRGRKQVVSDLPKDGEYQPI